MKIAQSKMLALWLKGMRNKTGLSIRAAAKASKISAMYWSELEAGKKLTFNPYIIRRIAKTIGTNANTLMHAATMDYSTGALEYLEMVGLRDGWDPQQVEKE